MCPHLSAAHRHYRPGSDCSLCGCGQFKPERPWALALAYLRERPEPVTADVLKPRPVRYPVPDRDDDGWDDNRTRLNIPIARPYAGGDPR
jgi:hypothetical protein